MNAELFDALMIMMFISNFGLLSSSRILACVSFLAFQGIISSIVPLTHSMGLAPLLFCVVIMLLKGFIFPWLIRRALSAVSAKREVEPIVGYTASILTGLLALIIIFICCRGINFNREILSPIGVPAAIFTIFTGLFLIVARVKALTQVIGYVVFENGIYLLGASLMIEQGFLVELGIILDLLGFVLIAGIVTFHINRAFDHIDTDNLLASEAETVKTKT
ncbi:MAG TPA: hypothetical protein PK821_03410 [Victivallales bacterium]|nr:hypothetical protein [Victivallales bacterium]